MDASLADWITRSRVRTVATESTGVYWIPLFQIFESGGPRFFWLLGFTEAEQKRPPSNRILA